MQEDISNKVKKKAYELGYDLCGINEANSFKEYSDHLNEQRRRYALAHELLKEIGMCYG